MDKHIRQADIFKPIKKKILILGAGGIGSATAFILSKMGCSNITVADFDKVELHNVASQFYGEDDLGELKTAALAENIHILTGEKIKTINERVGPNSEFGEYEIVIFALDSVNARKECYQAIKDSFTYLIDARMGGEVIDIYNFNKYTKRFYEESLPAEGEIVLQACTGKAIAYNTMAIGSFIGNIISKIYSDGEINQNIYFDFKTLTLTKN